MQERGALAALTDRRTATIAGVAVAVIALDQVTKTWAERALADGPIHVVWTLWLNLTYNSGAAFSSAQGLTPFITAVAVIVLIALVGVSRSITTRLGIVSMGLVIGGAAGNLVDRFFRGNHGAVIDFIDLRWWPVWNVADAAVVVGAVLLVLSSRRATA